MDADFSGVGIDAIDADRDGGGHAFIVETDVVDDLQAARTVGDERQAIGKFYIFGGSRQGVLGDKFSCIGGVGNIGDMQYAANTGQITDADRQTGTISDNGRVGDIGHVGIAE